MKKLIVSLHDVTPVLADRSKRITDIIMEKTGSSFTMLVVPDYHSKGRLDRYPEFCSWLRELQDLGVEIGQHGLTHLDYSARSPLPGRLFTDGEGEFLSSSASDAEERIRTGSDILSNAIGREPSGFTAPAWLYSRGTVEALRSFSYEWIEYRSFVNFSADGRMRSPVIVFASRTPWKRFCSCVWSGTAPLLLGKVPTLRVAFHVKDLPGLEKQVMDTVEKAAAGRVCLRCGEMAHTH